MNEHFPVNERIINAQYNAIQPTHAYAVLQRMRKDAEPIPRSICSWHCHPIQALSIAMIGPPWVDLALRPSSVDMMKAFFNKWEFMQFRVEEDESVPPDRIYFLRQDRELARIVSLAMPVIPKFEDEFR